LVKAYEDVADKKIGYLREVDGRGHMADDTDWMYAAVFLEYAKAKQPLPIPDEYKPPSFLN
jgi:hypothetical protein